MKKNIYLLLIIFYSINVKAQWSTGANGNITISTLNNVVNTYYHVNTIIPTYPGGIMDVTATNLPNKKYLLYQSTGVNAGNWEFISITASSGTSYTLGTFPTFAFGGGDMQLIDFPEYNDLTITSTGSITCQPYNYTNGTGGIVFFMVKNDFTVNGGKIDVSGKGFPANTGGIGAIGGVGGNGGAGGVTGGNGSIAGVPNTGIGGNGGYRMNNATSGTASTIPAYPGCNSNASNAGFPVVNTSHPSLFMGACGYSGNGGKSGQGAGGGGGGAGTTFCSNGTNGDAGGNGGSGGNGGAGGGIIFIYANNTSYTGTDLFVVNGQNGTIGSNATGGGNGGNGGLGCGSCTTGGPGGGGTGADGGNGGNGGSGGAAGFIYIRKGSGNNLTSSLYKSLGGSGAAGGSGAIGGHHGINAPFLSNAGIVCPVSGGSGAGSSSNNLAFSATCNATMPLDILQNVGFNGAGTYIIQHPASDVYIYIKGTDTVTLQIQSSTSVLITTSQSGGIHFFTLIDNISTTPPIINLLQNILNGNPTGITWNSSGVVSSALGNMASTCYNFIRDTALDGNAGLDGEAGENALPTESYEADGPPCTDISSNGYSDECNWSSHCDPIGFFNTQSDPVDWSVSIPKTFNQYQYEGGIATATSVLGCTYTYNCMHFPLSQCYNFDIIQIQPATCGLNNGAVQFQFIYNTCYSTSQIDNGQVRIYDASGLMIDVSGNPIDGSGGWFFNLAPGHYRIVSLFNPGNSVCSELVGWNNNLYIEFDIPDVSIPIINFTIVTPACTNPIGSIIANISGGAAPYTYLWSDGSTANFINATGGNFTVIITDANGCKDTATATLIAATNCCIASSSTTTISICNNQLPYLWNGLTFTATGSQTAHLTNVAGCDSSATLVLTVNTTTTTKTPFTACDSYFWSVDGNTYTTSGIYAKSSINAAGCTHSDTLDLTIHHSTSTKTVIDVCDNYFWSVDGNIYTTSGIYIKSSMNANGCTHTDSLVLTINHSIAGYGSEYYDDCCSPYTGCSYNAFRFFYNNGYDINNAVITDMSNGVRVYTITTQQGCKVEYTCTANYRPSYIFLDITNINNADCNGDNGSFDYTFSGCSSGGNIIVQYFTGGQVAGSPFQLSSFSGTVTGLPAGNYYVSYNSYYSSCSSLQPQLITIGQTTGNSSSTVYDSACNTYNWHGNTYTTSGTYYYNGTDANGCTINDTLVLTIKIPQHSYTNIISCDSYTWHGKTYNASGLYIDSSNCCKGIQAFDGSNRYFKYITLYDYDECTFGIADVDEGGFGYLVDGHLKLEYDCNGNSKVVEATGYYATIHPIGSSYSFDPIVSANPTYKSYGVCAGCCANSLGDKVYWILTNETDCCTYDSLYLTINKATSTKTVITACDNYLWSIDGNTYTTSGIYTKSSANAAGCTHIDSLILTIVNSNSSTTNITKCSSQLPFTWNGTAINNAGTTTIHLTNAAGCDSSAILITTIVSNPTATKNITVCANKLPYTYKGVSYNNAGTYTGIIGENTSGGCDTIITLNLTVTPNPTATKNITVCANKLPYTYKGVSYNNAGTYTGIIGENTSGGCDTIITLIISTKPISNSYSFVTKCYYELPFVWNGIAITAAGSYVSNNLINSEGCDSLATIGVVVDNNCPSLCVCNNEFKFNSKIIISGTDLHGGQFIDSFACGFSLTDQAQCNKQYNSYINYTSPWATNTCNAGVTGVFTKNGTTISSINNITAANRLVFSFTGNGMYCIKYYLTVNGNICDSCTACFNITCITPCTPTTSVNNITKCSNQLPFAWNGATINNAGTTTVHLNNSTGCDSTATLITTVITNPLKTYTVNICSDKMPYLFRGVTYNTPNTYTGIVGINMAGSCDTMITLVLTVTPNPVRAVSATVCANRLPYNFRGINYTAGTYTIIASSSVKTNCDTLITLIVDSVANPRKTIDTLVCANKLPLLFKGHYYGVGTYTGITAINTNGSCDTIITLNVTLKQNPSLIRSITICQSDLPYSWRNKIYTSGGIKYDTVPKSKDCDSVYILNLTVKVCPVCSDCDKAFDFTSKLFIKNTTTTQVTEKNCGDVFTLSCNTEYSYYINYNNPYSAICNAKDSAVLSYTTANGTLITVAINPNTSAANPLVYKPVNSGSYCIVHYLVVNGKVCKTCKVCFTVACPCSCSSVDFIGNTAIGWFTPSNSPFSFNFKTISTACGSTVSKSLTCGTTYFFTFNLTSLPTNCNVVVNSELYQVAGFMMVPLFIKNDVLNNGILNYSFSGSGNYAIIHKIYVNGVLCKSCRNDFTVCCTPVKPSNPVISGITLACTLNKQTILKADSTGGVWESGDTLIATVHPAKGIITPIATGETPIYYNWPYKNCWYYTSVNYLVKPVAVPDSTITSAINVCAGKSMVATNNTLLDSGSTGTWTSNNVRASVSGIGVITGNTAGTGSVKYTITNNKGCSNYTDKIFEVYNSPAVPSISYGPGNTINPQAGAPAGSFCRNRTFSLTGVPMGGVWSSTGVYTISQTGVVNTGSIVGNGSIIYTTSSIGGCNNSRVIAMNVAACAAKASTQASPINTLEYMIYPNPARSYIYIKVERLSGLGKITLNDLQGRKIKEQKLSFGENRLDINNISKGLYLLILSDINGNNKTEKIVVE